MRATPGGIRLGVPTTARTSMPMGRGAATVPGGVRCRRSGTSRSAFARVEVRRRGGGRPACVRRELRRHDVTRRVRLYFERMPRTIVVPEIAVATVRRYCADKIPAEHHHELRVEYGVRGKSITIFECRPPWGPRPGSEWTRQPVAQLRYNPADHHWQLFCSDRNSRWHDYDMVGPSPGSLTFSTKSTPTRPEYSGAERRHTPRLRCAHSRTAPSIASDSTIPERTRRPIDRQTLSFSQVEPARVGRFDA